MWFRATLSRVRPAILLFDIDGTLLNTGGAGRRAMIAAFSQHHARPDACTGFSFGGMTDPAIVRRSLQNIGASDDPGTISALIEAYLEHLAADLQQPTSVASLLPGVVALLERLAPRPQTAVGLGTGNVEAGALLKLAAVGLRERFSFGGFGSDAEERGELIRVGAQRGAASLGLSLERCRVVVLGDTPRDIEAARYIGAEVVAVATGPFSRAQLDEHTPTLCCDTLEDERVSGFLGL